MLYEVITLAAANAVIKNNQKRKEKALWSAGGPGALIESLLCMDEEDEARLVMERIHAERFKHELQYRDFAILYRTNVQSRAFEEQLRYENIPYVLIGGQQFFDRKEVKDALAYLRVILNPRDEVNLLRIRITSYNVCYTKLLRGLGVADILPVPLRE